MKTCEWCGRKIDPSCTRRRYCSQRCSDEYFANKTSKNPKPAPALTRAEPICVIEDLAREAGMSYGQYVSMGWRASNGICD